MKWKEAKCINSCGRARSHSFSLRSNYTKNEKNRNSIAEFSRKMLVLKHVRASWCELHWCFAFHMWNRRRWLHISPLTDRSLSLGHRCLAKGANPIGDNTPLSSWWSPSCWVSRIVHSELLVTQLAETQKKEDGADLSSRQRPATTETGSSDWFGAVFICSVH